MLIADRSHAKAHVGLLDYAGFVLQRIDSEGVAEEYIRECSKLFYVLAAFWVLFGLFDPPLLLDAAIFAGLAFWTREFVGLGPYRIVQWESGVQMALVRFDDYYRGPAPIDRIILRYIPDPTAMVANILGVPGTALIAFAPCPSVLYTTHRPCWTRSSTVIQSRARART